MYAHYFNNKTLIITDSNRPVGGKVYNVSGLREARKIAKQHNATPWNF